MFNNIDWNFIQKKLQENPKALGAVGTVAAGLTLVYFLTRSSDDHDDIDIIPDFAKQNIDYKFTSRFGKGKNRKRTMSDNRRKRPKPLQDNNTTVQQNDQELKYQEIDTDEKEIKYSLLDPTNPNYSYDMTNEDDYDEDNESENEEAFSADPFYVPFKVNNAKTKRKPDAPFMAMFTMYANKNKQSMDINDNKIEQNEIDMDMNEDEQHEDIIDGRDDEKKEDDNDNVDEDAGNSPPLNPHIPSHNIGALNGMNSSGKGINSLDNLRERYYKQELPKSLQPDVLSNAFTSDNQKAIQNDLNADDSLLGGIKQSVQMITQSND